MHFMSLDVRVCELVDSDSRRKVIEKGVVDGADKTSTSKEQRESSCDSHGGLESD
jgi:hypothetical protein